MDEGRETDQVSVDDSILGPNRHVRHARSFTVRDQEGEVICIADDLVSLRIYFGSRLEH